MSVRTAVERSASPTAVSVALERLTEAHPGLAAQLEEDGPLRAAVVAVTAASRSLTELLLSDPSALAVVADLDRRPVPEGELRRWKRLELLRLAARDLLGIDDLPVVGQALARMAAEVLQTSVEAAGASGLAVIGMGKLGGQELN